MKEFVFLWNIENISYSWHSPGNSIISPSFTAGPLSDSVWMLKLYPRGETIPDYFSLYLHRKDNGSQLSINFELSCISADNLTLQSFIFTEKDMSCTGFGHPRFLSRHQVFSRKNVFILGDVLTIRCRMWKNEGTAKEFGQKFGRTCLLIERILFAEHLSLKVREVSATDVRLKRDNISLISISLVHVKDSMKVVIKPENTGNIKYSVLKLTFIDKTANKILYVHTSSWFGSHMRETWRLPIYSKIIEAGNQDSLENNIELLSEFVYSKGEETTYLENSNLCSSRLSDPVSKYVKSISPSGKLSDCPGVSQNLWNLYAENILCDTEIKTPKTSFFVHKTVLCARSSVFLAMLTGDMKEKVNNCIQIEDIVDDILEKFLHFLYTDSFEDLKWEAVTGLYYAADKYQVERLKMLCCSFLLNNINAYNVCESLLLAERHNDSDFKKRVENFILQNDEKVFSSSTWKQFVDEQPHLSAKTMLLKYDKERGKEKAKETYEESLARFPDVLDDFRSVYESKIFSDIIIKTKDATFHAHKSVLCASSSALKEAFAKDVRDKHSDPLKMEDLEDDTVSRLLLFLYTDSLEGIEWDSAIKLYHAADVYDIQRLKIESSCFLLKNIGISNASDLLLLAHQHSDVKLKSVVEDFIFLHDEEIFGSDEWAEFGKANLLLAHETVCLKYRKSCDLT